MSQESKSLTAIHPRDEEIPSMLQIITEANKVLRRLAKHAAICQCCREVLEYKDG